MNKLIVSVAQIALGVFVGTEAANVMENVVVKPIKKVIQAKKMGSQK